MTSGKSAEIGLMLKRSRESNGTAQADIASVLGYQNANFISMLESGRSNVPLAKIADVVSAYQLNGEMAMVILKQVHPDVWEFFTKLIIQNKKILNGSISTLNSRLDEKYEKIKMEIAEY